MKRKVKFMDTPGRRFFEEQLSLLQQGKTDELIDRHYHADAVLISTTRTVRGQDALKANHGKKPQAWRSAANRLKTNKKLEV
jgi:hypothetical protein